MYKEAIKNKWVFDTVRGQISVQDLFDLPLISNNHFNLDAVAVNLSEKIDKLKTKSFVKIQSKAKKQEKEVLLKQLEIVKDIISDKIAEQKAIRKAQENAQRRNKILELLAQKQDDKLSQKSEEDLLDELERLKD